MLGSWVRFPTSAFAKKNTATVGRVFVFPRAKGGSNVEIKDCAIYDCAVGLRIEDRAENLKIDKLGFGKGVGKKYHILKDQPGPGFEKRGEYEAPAFEMLLKQGFPPVKK